MPIKKLSKYIKGLEVNETLAVGIIIIVIAIPTFIFLEKKSDTVSNIDTEKAFIENNPRLTDDAITNDIDTKIVWEGKIHQRMTYGRITLKNINPGAKYKYFVAEPTPDDVVIDGALRYSPSTRYLKNTDIIKITGVISSIDCYGSGDTKYDIYSECIPWVYAKIEKEDNLNSVIDPKTGGFTKELMEKLHSDRNSLLLSTKATPTSYEGFLKELEKQCPYYKPDGATYRGCLYDLLKKYDQTIDIFSDELTRDIKIVISEIKTHPDGFADAKEYFLSSFIELQKHQKSYRTALCTTDHAINYGGSDQGGLMATCQLYEADKYLEHLIGYRFNWVASQVSRYLKEGTQPNTEAFWGLIDREESNLQI